MAEAETTDTTTDAENGTEGKEGTDEQRVPYERFQQANKKAKDAADQAKALQKQLDDIKAQMDEREQQGLPELDQLKKRLDAAEKRAEAAETERDSSKTEAANARKERWVESAAQQAKFIYPDLAAREVNLDDIESPEDAERAIKKVAKARPKLIEADDPQLPGRVLENGRQKQGDQQRPRTAAESDAEVVGNALQEFLRNRSGSFSGQ